MARNRDPFTQALSSLRERIHSGALPAGAPVIVQDEAGRLRLSTTPPGRRRRHGCSGRRTDPPIESAVGDAFGRIAVGAAGRRPCREGDRQDRLAFLETF